MESILPQLSTARAVSSKLRALSDEEKSRLLNQIADHVQANAAGILAANQIDLSRMDDTDPKKDRLLLDEKRIQNLADSLRQVAQLPDPAGKVILEKEIKPGLKLTKMAVPLGVVGVIYESRPNVTLDVASLCLRSGNACILKGGKEAHESNLFLVSLIHEALKQNNLPEELVTLLPTDRKFVQELLEATRFVDIIIPRGSESLIKYVRENSKIPTIETGAGVCHTYVEQSADLDMAKEIVINAKVSRPSVCNSLDTILVDRTIAEAFLPTLINGFKEYQVEVFADETAFPILEKEGYSLLQKATEADFGREFLDFKCSVKVVSNTEEALQHIAHYSSRHSEAIVSGDPLLIAQFLNEVDAAAVYANASTRFTDGGEFGLGAEIGISTQKLHARGPFALEKLVTEKWVVQGEGHVRW